MTKCCALCGEEFDEDGLLVVAIEHYIGEHPRSSLLVEALNRTPVTIECSGCGEEFIAEATYAPEGKIGADAYCPDCSEEGFNSLYATELTPEALVEREAACADTNPEKRTSCAGANGGV